MPRIATFHNVTALPDLMSEISKRGYGNAHVHKVIVSLDADYGPLEATETPFDMAKDIALILLVLYAIYTLTCSRRR